MQEIKVENLHEEIIMLLLSLNDANFEVAGQEIRNMDISDSSMEYLSRLYSVVKGYRQGK